LVKAFNAIVWTRLRDGGIPISGDDEQAKRAVAALIDQIGFDPVDAGSPFRGWKETSTGKPGYRRET